MRQSRRSNRPVDTSSRKEHPIATRTRIKKAKPTPTIDELLPTNGRRRGVCPRCGGTAKKVGQVTLNAKKLGPEGSSKGAVNLRSIARSLCGPCTKEVYIVLEATFEEELENPS